MPDEATPEDEAVYTPPRAPARIRVLMKVLPAEFFYADHLTHSGRMVLKRASLAFVGVVVIAGTIALAADAGWQGGAAVLVGIAVPWGAAIILWAKASYGQERTRQREALARLAELDLLHLRLNHIAAHLGLPTLEPDSELDNALAHRIERLAHFTGLDEYREAGLDPHERPGALFWYEQPATPADDTT